MWKKYFKLINFPESFVSITLGFLVVIVAGLLLYNFFSKNKQSSSPEKNETTAQEKNEEQVAVLPATYTVSASDNLWKIAEKYYGSGYNWVTIASENSLINPNYILVGQVLSIPKAEVIKPAQEKVSSTATEPEKTYIVIQGDYLWKIAVKEYSDGFAWTKIAQANNLVNPNIIHAGNVLRLPK